jgi:hypothetical protein
VCPFPIEDSDDLSLTEVKVHVLRTEVPVNDHNPAARKSRHRIRRQRLELPQAGADEAQDRSLVSLVNQLLTMATSQCRHNKARNREIALQDERKGELTSY